MLMKCRIKLLIYSTFFAFAYSQAVAQKFNVRYTSATQSNFSGNVFLYFSKDNRNPKEGGVGVESFPCYRKAVKNIKPNQPVLFDDGAVSYPVPLSDIERGEYYV